MASGSMGLRQDGLRLDGLRQDGLRQDGLRQDGLAKSHVTNITVTFKHMLYKILRGEEQTLSYIELCTVLATMTNKVELQEEIFVDEAKEPGKILRKAADPDEDFVDADYTLELKVELPSLPRSC